MAGWKMHLLGGVIFSMIIFVVLFGIFGDWLNLLFVIPIVFLYALLPDADHENSKITYTLLSIGIIANVIAIIGGRFGHVSSNYSLFTSVLLLVLLFIIKLPHRGITHSLTAAVFFSLPLLYFNYWLAIAGFIAYQSHLFLDMKPGSLIYPIRLWGAWR